VRELVKVLVLGAVIVWHALADSPVASSVEGSRAERGSIES